jgi:hypothetical protein
MSATHFHLRCNELVLCEGIRRTTNSRLVNIRVTRKYAYHGFQRQPCRLRPNRKDW